MVNLRGRAAIVTYFIALPCIRCDAPDGYVIDNSTNIGYKLFYEAQTWPVARDKCEDDGAKLAVPKSMDEFLFMRMLVRQMQYPNIVGSKYQLLVWLGINNLDDYRVWKNIDGENIEDTGFHTWSPGNGVGYSDAPEEPHCAGLDAVNMLRDFWCHLAEPFLCQKYFKK
ncbi:unnamed protein product [Euphydryas editha]|uniref:C-type lectin domain-containing protein n=1 Tax=Euphydryas editha TaxID=104508 RepID=A0AAU9TTB3_EUPED|nr:unnamed protein product [Euphydryas editha]